MAQIRGDSPNDDGVVGSSGSTGKSGVFGFNDQADGNGVAGRSDRGNGVFGFTKTLKGIFGESDSGRAFMARAGLPGESAKFCTLTAST